MAVLRGSGPAGLGAWRREKHIFERGTGAEPRIPVIRPLVTFHREEVIAYLRARELSWREDSSNTDTRFFRNRVRRVLVPLLDREFPGWKSPLLRLNETQAMTADFLDSRARHTLPWRGNADLLSVDEAAFFAQSPVIREEALFAALDALGEERPRRAALRPFAGGARHTLDLGYARLERGGGLVSVKRASVVKGERGFSLLIKCPGFYKLEQQAEQSVSAGLVLEARAGGGAGNAANGEFRVFLPFVLRALSGGQRLEARDKAGQAALFDARGVSVWKRNGEGDAAARLEAARRVARE
jgi:tRNA(Ile)-lysidine synthase